MSTRNVAVEAGRVFLMAGCYAVVYFVGSGLDLWTTVLALHRPGIFEGNVFATTSGAYNSAKAWWTTDAAGALLTGLFALGIWYGDRVSPEWLEKPIRSYFYRHFNPLFLNFWSKNTRDRVPLHAVSFAIAFVALRLLAAANNLMIATGNVGPLGFAVHAVGHATNPAVGLMLVMGTIYIALALALSPLSAYLLQSQSPQHRSELHA